MTANMNFNLTSVFSKNQKIFFYFGFWKVNDHCKFKFFYKLYTCLCFAFMISFLLPQFVYMLVNGNDILKVTGTMYVFCTFFVNLVKTSGVYFKMDAIKELLRNFKRSPLLQVKCRQHFIIAKKMQKLSNYLFFYGSFLGVGTQVFWTLAPYFQEQRTLPIKGWFPYDAMSSPYFQATNVFISLASAFNILHTMNIDSFTINLMMEVGMECDFLRVTLENLTMFSSRNGILKIRKQKLNRFYNDFNHEMSNNLKLCIQHFIEIKRIGKTIENIYSVSLATLFLGGAFILCTIFYQLMLIGIGSLDFFYLMFFLFSMLTEQFIFCWFGNEMTYRSQRMFRAVYNIPAWIDCDVKFRRALLLFMMSVQKPIVVYAGHLIPLSVGVFIHVLRTSYSYFTLLNQM
nr:odorant receptor 4 [Pachyrhinus yasumatsui]